MMKTYEIESYDRKATGILGHICWSESKDTLEEAKIVAKQHQEQGNIRIRILKGKQEVLRYAEQG
jgi:hypothetical protein